jgi:hypothetical protein
MSFRQLARALGTAALLAALRLGHADPVPEHRKDRVFPLSEYRQAFELAEKGGLVGKAVIRFG